jgi:hypothetical protein
VIEPIEGLLSVRTEVVYSNSGLTGPVIPKSGCEHPVNIGVARIRLPQPLVRLKGADELGWNGHSGLPPSTGNEL